MLINIDITASNLTAENATILAGKFRDEGIDIVTNNDAKLMINSAFNTYDNKTTVKKITPNYVGIALVGGGSVYGGYLINDYLNPNLIKGISVALAVAGLKNFNPSNSGGILDPIFNIRTSDKYFKNLKTEIKTNLNFNNLTNQ